MAKKYFPKALSVGLSLALCASLVAPALAASFADVQWAIQNNDSYDHEAITVTQDETGRTVTLNQDIQRADNEGAIAVHENNGNVTINLNGYMLNGDGGKGGSVLSVDGGSLTIQDTSDEGTGTITGGTGGSGGAIYISGTGHVTLDGGTITGNTAESSGGGVGVKGANASFTMNGGEISGNAVTNKNGGGGGGGVWVKEGATFEMNGGEITDNTVNKDGGSGGGVAVHQANFIMNGGTIADNTAVLGDGVQVHGTTGSGANQGPSSFIMTDGTIAGDVNVRDDGGNAAVTINGGTFDNLDPKYLPEGHSLDSNGVLTHTYEDGSCIACGKEEPASPVTPDTTPTTTDPVITDEPEVEIDDVAVPLAAGPVTCAEFIDYLWRHEGEPEADLVVEHEYAEAISWALSIEIIDGETFDADELVTVAAVRDILANFAAYADMDVNVYALATLTGDEDEAVLNCDEVLAEFFGE